MVQSNSGEALHGSVRKVHAHEKEALLCCDVKYQTDLLYACNIDATHIETSTSLHVSKNRRAQYLHNPIQTALRNALNDGIFNSRAAVQQGKTQEAASCCHAAIFVTSKTGLTTWRFT
jgi:hypothetical protein